MWNSIVSVPDHCLCFNSCHPCLLCFIKVSDVMLLSQVMPFIVSGYAIPISGCDNPAFYIFIKVSDVILLSLVMTSLCLYVYESLRCHSSSPISCDAIPGFIGL